MIRMNSNSFLIRIFSFTLRTMIFQLCSLISILDRRVFLCCITELTCLRQLWWYNVSNQVTWCQNWMSYFLKMTYFQSSAKVRKVCKEQKLILPAGASCIKCSDIYHKWLIYMKTKYSINTDNYNQMLALPKML